MNELERPNGDPHGLIGDLDPDRDYGDRTYEQVVADVHAGVLQLDYGRTKYPYIRDTATYRAVKGTGPIAIMAGQTKPRWGREAFYRRAVDDFDAAYEELREMMKSSTKAQQIWWELFLGKPDRITDSAMPDVVREFLKVMTRTADGKPVVDG